MGLKKFLAAAAFATIAAASGASAATLNGAVCGNKYIGLSQAGSELTATMCMSGNSTGGKNSPIGQAGWTALAEVGGTGTDGILSLDQSLKTWSLSSNGGYLKLGISIKEGNGFAFYVLDTTKALSGMFGTGTNAPSGSGVSHVNAWGMGSAVVPLPAAGLMLIAGLGGIAALKRRKKA